MNSIVIEIKSDRDLNILSEAIRKQLTFFSSLNEHNQNNYEIEFLNKIYYELTKEWDFESRYKKNWIV